VRVSFVPPDRSLVGRVSSAVSGRWSIEKVEALGQGDPVSALARASNGQDVLVYVHGYNESFETAVLGAAELSEGIAFAGQTVAFTWPSKAGLLDYGYDRESALWSRDAFQETLDALARNTTVGRVHVVAHSMGSLLTLESLRQLWAGGANPDVAARLGAVVFASPDIDVDLFAASLPKIGPLARHITVIGSTNDRALAVSARLAGGVARAGGADRAMLEPLGVKVVDASDYGWGVIRHDLFLSNADVRAVVKRAIERGGQA
jgi:esterase/lipase superfamily enzyme